MSVRRPPTAVLAILVLVSLAAVAPALADGPGTDAVGQQKSSDKPTLAVATPENNSTVRHRNPENTSRQGDLGMYQRWLAGQMSEVLIDCTEAARARQFGLCELNQSYPEWLGKFVDLARETDDEDDDVASDAFTDTQVNQHEFNENLDTYWTTYRSYQEARADRNATRARELARELRRLNRRTNATADALIEDYRTISDRTAANLSEAESILETIVANLSETTRTVEATEFTETTLTVEANRTVVSFLRPLGVTGRLTTADGAPIRNRSVRLAIANQTIRTRTDADGRFRLAYRPTTLPLAAEEVTITYRPRNESVYLPASGTVPVSVEQVEPTVSANADPAIVGFDDRLVLRGAVRAEDIPAANVPVRVSLAGTRSMVVRTDADGTYAARVRVPATISAGTREVTGRVALTERALAPASETTTVTITETETALTVTAEQGSGRDLAMEGTLKTTDRTAVPGQPVDLTINATFLASPETSTTGHYATQVSPPAGMPSNATVRVVATFGGEGTNLAGTQVMTRVRLEQVGNGADGTKDDTSAATGDGGDSGPIDRVIDSLVTAEDGFRIPGTNVRLTPLGLAVVVALAIVVLAILYLLVTRTRLGAALVASLPSRGRSDTETAGESEEPTPAIRKIPDETAASGTASEPTVVDQAREVLAGGNADEAVSMAYTSVRERLAERVDEAPAATHWEFYIATRGRLADDNAAALELLTEAYEAAAFAPQPIDPATAGRALEAAAHIDIDTLSADTEDGEFLTGDGEA